MKRLMVIAFMFISYLVHADDANPPAANATDNQSSSDSLKKADDVSVSIANVHHINLDTTQVDGGGNWLNKRLWYERAQNVFDEILVQVNSMTDLRIQFSNESNAAGHKIDAFFEEVDFTKSELDSKFKEILVALDTEQKIVGDLSAEERNLQATIKQEIKVIEQIGKNIKSIGEVDNKIDETMMQAFKTIDESKDYQTKAWDTFKSIGKELDDKKARNLYYQMNNYKQNIDQKITYLKNSLLPYLHNVLVAKIDSNIAKINQSMADLKTKGIDLQKIMSKTQEDDIIALHEREKAATQVAVRKAVEEEEQKTQQQIKEQTEKFEKELQEAEKKSFSNVMHQYYKSTIGRVVDFVHKGYTGMSIDYIGSLFTGFFKSYSYPIITYCYHTALAGKAYMQNLVTSLMIHYGGKPAVKAAIVERIEQKIEQAQESGQTIKEIIQEKIAEKNQTTTALSTSSSDTSAVSMAPVATTSSAISQATITDATIPSTTTNTAAVTTPDTTSTATNTSTPAPAIATMTTSDATAQAVTPPVTTTTPAAVPANLPSAPLSASDVTLVTTTQSPLLPFASVVSTVPAVQSNQSTASSETKPADQVIVQSLTQDVSDDQESIKRSSLYQLFKAVLNFIGTMFMSLYRCVSQFFVMIWKFATYVTFTN